MRIRWILFLFCSCLLIISCKNPPPSADTLFYNAQFFSFGKENLDFTALAVKDGKVLDHGTLEELEEKYHYSERIDLKKNVVYPGFHDAHCHFLALGKGLDEVDLKGKTSWIETVNAVVDYHKKFPDRKWIIGRGWDQNLWNDKSFPDRYLLDSLFPGIPVMLSRVDGHAVIVNAKALQLAGINKHTEVAGGELYLRPYIRSALPELSGVLVDNAVDLVKKVIPAPGAREQKEWLLKAEKACLAYGITAVTDAGIPLDVVKLADSLHKAGEMKIRINAMLNPDEEGFAFAAEKGIYQTPALSVCGFKLYADGALGSWGAWLKKPYCDHAHENGLALNDFHYFDSVCKRIYNIGYQVNTHCIGDSANRLILEVYARYLEKKNDRRWRVEHAQIVDTLDFHFFRDYSIIPSVQPTHATSDMSWALNRLCAYRMPGAYAYKSLLAYAGILPLGTDFPVEEVNPFLTYLSAVYRKNSRQEPEGGFLPGESLDHENAMRGMTYWPAYAAFKENEWGSFDVGAYADMVVLPKAINTVVPEELAGLRVISTWISGRQAGN